MKGKAREAQRELDRTKKSQKAATAKCQSEAESTAITTRAGKADVRPPKEQIDRCTIKAPEDGIVVYFKRYYDESSADPTGRRSFTTSSQFSRYRTWIT